jgi:hypothetical protein
MSGTNLGGGSAPTDFRAAVESILRQHRCHPLLLSNGQAQKAANGEEIWWYPTRSIPILLPSSIPSAWAANNIISFLGLGRLFK